MTEHERYADTDADKLDGRNESVDEKSDRNWNEILQELRVTQTGTQIISGFLLTVVFQQRFKEATAAEVAFYVALVVMAGITTALGLAPVGIHRALFGTHQKKEVVLLADRFLSVVLVCVALLTAGVVTLVVTFALGWLIGILAGTVLAMLLVVVLVAIPSSARRALRITRL